MNTPHLGKIDHPFLMNADHDNQKMAIPNGFS